MSDGPVWQASRGVRRLAGVLRRGMWVTDACRRALGAWSAGFSPAGGLRDSLEADDGQLAVSAQPLDMQVGPGARRKANARVFLSVAHFAFEGDSECRCLLADELQLQLAGKRAGRDVLPYAHLHGNCTLGVGGAEHDVHDIRLRRHGLERCARRGPDDQAPAGGLTVREAAEVQAIRRDRDSLRDAEHHGQADAGFARMGRRDGQAATMRAGLGRGGELNLKLGRPALRDRRLEHPADQVP